MLEAFDLTGSLRDAAELAGCSHHTVAKHVAARDAGRLTDQPAMRPMLIDEFLPKLEEWMEHSKGKIRADIAHDKLLALGYLGSERTTRRAVAAARAAFKSGRVRVHRPWVTEPGMWLQYDFGDGPVIDGVSTVLFCAWLAWSRFRVVLALRDKTMPSVFAALDVTLRRVGGVPTYLLTDNEKTVTVEHVAGIAVRNPQMLAFARHYGVTVHTCEPADPASKGGSESTVKLAKADLVPKDTNLLAAYGSFAELEAACAAFCDHVNTRIHRVTRRAPVDMLAEEQARLHRAADHGAYGRVRGDPHRRGQDPDGRLRRRAVLGAASAARRTGVGPHPRCRRRRAGDHRATSATTARSRWRGTGGPRRAARAWTTPISRRHRPGWTGRRNHAPQLRASSSPSVTAPGCG